MDSNEAREEAAQLSAFWYWQDYFVLAYVWKGIRLFSLGCFEVYPRGEEGINDKKQKAILARLWYVFFHVMYKKVT